MESTKIKSEVSVKVEPDPVEEWDGDDVIQDFDCSAFFVVKEEINYLPIINEGLEYNGSLKPKEEIGNNSGKQIDCSCDDSLNKKNDINNNSREFQDDTFLEEGKRPRRQRLARSLVSKKQETSSKIIPRFICGYCSYKGNHKMHFIEHLRVHTDEKPYKCHFCNYKAKRSSHLTRHLKSHKTHIMGECHQLICSHCGFSSMFKSSLIRHMRKHTGEKPFACTLCGFRATEKFAVTLHMASCHLKEKPFICDHCGYSTGTRSRLAQHIKIHCKEKPFKCCYCKFSAVTLRILNYHLRKKH